MRYWVRSIVVAAAMLGLGGLFVAPALAADKTCQITRRGSRAESIKPGETLTCRGESGAAGNVTVTCRFDQDSPTDAHSQIQFGSRNYKTVDGPKGGDILDFNAVKPYDFRGDTEQGHDYQFIFKNVSDPKTPSVTVSCEY
jgi:hypothetical protein